MEDDFRPFNAVNIGLTTVESGRERFTRDRHHNPPPVAHWRNNLTGLSQRFNLYFVASRDSIAVYKPDFPFHRLHRLPALLIPAYLANPDTDGYIDTRSPHSINHLVVGDLGSEEILLVSTDSGNITAYYTKTIEEAIRKHPYRFSTDARSDSIGVRAFFAQWVHESAWGLAIHTNARMIAVSANTPWHCDADDACAKVTVFAFALEGSAEDAEDLDLEISDESGHARPADWRVWGVTQDTAPPRRNKNYKISLSGIDGHSTNIPSISFVNTADDPDGLWLLSTDIGGEMKMWDIWRGICLKSWDFSAQRIQPSYLRPQEGGWLVAALDPGAFRSALTMEQFCGYVKAPQYHGHVGESYDISHVVRLRTPGNSYAHPSMVEVDEEHDEEDPDLPLDSWSDIDEASVDRHHHHHHLRQNINSLSADSLAINDHPLFGATNSSWPNSGLAVDEARTRSEPRAGPSSNPRASELFEADEPYAMSEGAESGSAEFEEEVVQYESSADDQADDLSSPSHHSIRSPSSLAERNSQEIEVDILSYHRQDSPSPSRQLVEKAPLKHLGKARSWNPNTRRMEATSPVIPTLHCSSSNMRLLFAPTSNTPHVFCANVLKQAMPPEFERTNFASMDRLNMLQQIPELGVVVVASQLGRCAVCTLTRYEKTGILGLRVDWTLPFKKQEIKKLRPAIPLLGIATSPIQGMFIKPPPSESLTHDAPARWGMNGTFDGVPTTFDHSVVLVTPQSLEHDDQLDGEEDAFDSSPDGDEHKLKRKRLSYDGVTSKSSQKRAEDRRWEIPNGPESWQAMENTRRYRLMLTYTDMTVMTYEISRGVERDDIRQDEIESEHRA